MSLIFFNDEYIDEVKPIFTNLNSGITTGIGIFDSMLAQDNKLIHGAEHYERILYDSETVIGLKPRYSYKEFEKICLDLLEKNKLTKGFARIRTTVTGGEVNAPLTKSKKIDFLISAGTAENPEGLSDIKCAVINEFPRIARCVLENCKRLDYTRSYAARRKAESMGANEAILTNTDGNIACGATSNVFIKENGTLITPPLNDGVLAGVTRKKLMEERDILEESISLDRLQNADSIYLTNSFFGLRLVTLL